MKGSALNEFVNSASRVWTGLNSQTTAQIRQLLIEFIENSKNEIWLNELQSAKPPALELYRDPRHGFILLAHTEKNGQYRVPHDHGAGWVFYAVQSGKMEMTTYKLITSNTGKTELVSRGMEILETGDCKVFLPGDIHDTRCLTDDFVQFRLTSCDFSEELKSRRMIRFNEH